MKYLIVLILGLVLGAGATVFLLGMPRPKSTPGAVVQAPASSGDPASTVVVSVSNRFFELLLQTLFRDLAPPAFRLGQTQLPGEAQVQPISFFQGCTNTITLAQEGSNVRTQVQFADGKIAVPLAFSGSYNLLG